MSMQEAWVWSLGQEDPLEKDMATHSTILALEIPWTEEPSSLQFMESLIVGWDSATEHAHMNYKPNTEELMIHQWNKW